MYAIRSYYVILKQAGVAVGWGVQFQEPLFLLFMIALLTIFACNLFGIFEFAIPAFAKDTYEKISNKIDVITSYSIHYTKLYECCSKTASKRAWK